MINREVVENVAKLSRLYLEEDEIVLYAQQLSQILDTIEELRQIDTDKVEALAHVISVENVSGKSAGKYNGTDGWNVSGTKNCLGGMQSDNIQINDS